MSHHTRGKEPNKQAAKTSVLPIRYSEPGSADGLGGLKGELYLNGEL